MTDLWTIFKHSCAPPPTPAVPLSCVPARRPTLDWEAAAPRLVETGASDACTVLGQTCPTGFTCFDAAPDSRAACQDGALCRCRRDLACETDAQCTAVASGLTCRDGAQGNPAPCPGAGAGSKGHLSRIEKGLVRPTVETLALVAERLGVDLLDLLTFPEDSPRQRLVDRTRQLKVGTVRRLLRESEA